tara:strand:+ start:399 stop:719 length:321 start_codon:yes stop_codon:yes gene_type:complete
MATVEEQVQEIAANQPMILYRLEQAEATDEKLGKALEALPVLANTVSEWHDRIVRLEEAVEAMADHNSGSKNRQIATIGGVGVVGLGAGNIDFSKMLELLGKLFGA